MFGHQISHVVLHVMCPVYSYITNLLDLDSKFHRKTSVILSFHTQKNYFFNYLKKRRKKKGRTISTQLQHLTLPFPYHTIPYLTQLFEYLTPHTIILQFKMLTSQLPNCTVSHTNRKRLKFFLKNQTYHSAIVQNNIFSIFKFSTEWPRWHSKSF